MIIFYFKLIIVLFVTGCYSVYATIKMAISGGEVFHKLARNWSYLLLKIVGIKIEIIDFANLDKSKTYIYAVNHSSLFDIPILLYGLNDNARIMYKEELEKIPIFGYVLKLSPFISIQRADARNAMEAIDSSAKSIKEGDSVIIFPEGTRSVDGNLGEFKRGAFLLATKAEKPIVPVTIVGSYNILPKGQKKLSPGTVKLIINQEILNESDSKQSQIKLLNEVRDIISENLEKYSK